MGCDGDFEKDRHLLDLLNALDDGLNCVRLWRLEPRAANCS